MESPVIGAAKEEPNTIARIVVSLDVTTGVLQVGGHIDNTFLVLRMLATAGAQIITRNAEKDGGVVGRPDGN